MIATYVAVHAYGVGAEADPAMLAALNNASALVTGTSLFYGLSGPGSFIGPGAIVALAMLVTGALTYGILSLRPGQAGTGAFRGKELPRL